MASIYKNEYYIIIIEGRFPVEILENKLAFAMNSGGFTLSLIAAFAEVGSVKYVLRIEKPN